LVKSTSLLTDSLLWQVSVAVSLKLSEAEAATAQMA
jgi:hypothetical protein